MKEAIFNLGTKKVPASKAIDGSVKEQSTTEYEPVQDVFPDYTSLVLPTEQKPQLDTPVAKPLNYPRNEELVVQCVISSEAEGYALLRALQMVVNTFGANAIVTMVTKLEKNPKLADTARRYIPLVMSM